MRLLPFASLIVITNADVRKYTCSDGEQTCQTGSSLLQMHSVSAPTRKDQDKATKSATTEAPEDIVDLLAGTNMNDGDSNGNTLPQVKVPWGFNDWVPQTSGQSGSRWFHHAETSFQGMRCTHQPSPWIGDYSYITILPHIGSRPVELQYFPEKALFRPYMFKSNLIQPGATSESILFELTPTSHAAVIRTKFPANAEVPCISVQGDQLWEKDGMLFGYTTHNSGGVPDNWKMYFVLKAASAEVVVPDKFWSMLSGEPTYGTLKFTRASGRMVHVAVATSFISADQAMLNLDKEVGSKSFDDVAAEARAEWRSALNRVQVQALGQAQLRIFYTNLWKALLFPRFIHETDAEGHNVHASPYTGQVTPGRLVADSGFWDAYHTVYPLESVIYPETYGAIIDGWVNTYNEAGWLPTWASPGQRNSMVSTMGDVSLADAIVKSKLGFVSGFDVEAAYEAIRKDAFVPGEGSFGRAALPEYIKDGYVPMDRNMDSVAETLNYYVADAAIARAAESLGKKDDHALLQARSKRYASLFNTESEFFQPKDERGFSSRFDSFTWGNGFTEGGPWQYRFYLPHDVDGLKGLYRGKLCDKIKDMMSARSGITARPGSYGFLIHEMTELTAIQNDFGQYSHNNQPSHEVLWIAKKAGCDDLADKYLRLVMEKLYTEEGWSGDEDNGEMASWYILSALGIYSLEGGKDELVIGSPAVVRAEVLLPNNKVLFISTKNQSRTNVFVQMATWTPMGGQPRRITNNVLKYSELMSGGELSFSLSDAPRATAVL